ncbi:hypothetical protein [Brucella sp. CMUL 015]|uniref:hypothetical protein n=1 Tax=Brucella sp. CMUL 015 TaxID=1905697 RepID=UPI00094F81BF|nr:hypothetical protein [Brucella sp. CMUL 015]
MDYEALLDKVDKLTLGGNFEEALELIEEVLNPLFFPEDVVADYKLRELVELNKLKVGLYAEQRTIEKLL